MNLINEEMSFEEYTKAEGINASTLKQGDTSIAHMRYAMQRDANSGTTSTMQFGRLVHSALLEPDKFSDNVVVYPGARRAGKEWKEFKAQFANADIVKQNEMNDIMDVVDAVFLNETSRNWCENGTSECCIFWDDPDTGVQCKAMLDKVAAGRYIMDVKTTKARNSREFVRECMRYKYGLQFGWYARGWKILTGETLPFFVLAIENSAPWSVMCYEIPQHVIDDGEKRALQVLDDYLNDDIAESVGIVELDLPELCEEEELVGFDVPCFEGTIDDINELCEVKK